MPCVHTVLVKVKEQVLTNEFEEFRARIETIRDLEVVKSGADDVALGPPMWPERSEGYNYGLYFRFKDRESLERYKEDPAHKECVREINAGSPRRSCCRTLTVGKILMPGILAFDWEY